MASAALRWPPPVPEPLPVRLPSFAIRVQRRARCDMRPLRRSLRPDHHGGGLPRHPPSSDFPSARGHSTLASYRPLPEAGTFGAGRRGSDLPDSSLVRIDAQSRAQLESPRARVPYMAGSEFSPATVLRGAAHTSYWKCFLGAYGSHRPSAGTPRRTSSTKFPAPPADRRRDPELPVTVAYVAGTTGRKICSWSLVRTPARTRAETEFCCVRNPCYRSTPLLATTLLRTYAHAQYRRRYRSAFDQRWPPTGAPRPYVVVDDPDATNPLTGWPCQVVTLPVPTVTQKTLHD